MLKKFIFVLSMVLSVNANAGIYTYSNQLVIDKTETKENDVFYVERQNRYITLNNGTVINTVDIINNLKQLNEMADLKYKYSQANELEFNEAFYDKLVSKFSKSMHFLQDKARGNLLVIFENGNKLIVVKPKYRYNEVVQSLVYKGNIFYTYNLTKDQASQEAITFKFNFNKIKANNGIESTIFTIKSSDE